MAARFQIQPIGPTETGNLLPGDNYTPGRRRYRGGPVDRTVDGTMPPATPAVAPVPVPTFGTPSATPDYLKSLLVGGLSPQDAVARFNQETGRGYGNEAVYYGNNNTIGLPEAYLSTGVGGWNVTTRSPEGPGGGGGGVQVPPQPQGWAKYKTPDGVPFADQVEPGLWKDEKGRTWAFGANGALAESKVPGQVPTGNIAPGVVKGLPPPPPDPQSGAYVPGKGVPGMGSIYSMGLPAGPEKDFYNELLKHRGVVPQSQYPGLDSDFAQQLATLYKGSR